MADYSVVKCLGETTRKSNAQNRALQKWPKLNNNYNIIPFKTTSYAAFQQGLRDFHLCIF